MLKRLMFCMLFCLAGPVCLAQTPNKVLSSTYIMLQVKTVYMIRQDGCRACDEWMNYQAPKLRKQGWKVSEITIDQMSVPQFVIVFPDKDCWLINNYVNAAEFNRMVSLILKHKENRDAK